MEGRVPDALVARIKMCEGLIPWKAYLASESIAGEGLNAVFKAFLFLVKQYEVNPPSAWPPRWTGPSN